jgi:hypothetical protein
MRILLLSPEPFYQERGTPIAVSLVLRVYSERGDAVDVIAYHEGTDVDYRNVSIHRIKNLPFVRDIRPGFSWKKVFCDVLVFAKAISLLRKNRYAIIHAIEESVFMAMILKIFFKIPYVYDMDSSLVQQMIERFPYLKPFGFPLKFFEKLAVRNAEAVLPVCEALASAIKVYEPRKVVVLPDISLLPDEKTLP